ncbi:MAG: hypothetical protein NZM43_13645 [Saprospiraceae bacterium]|nr:hypothetical protein [Saprospiraceae bacterium]MDW8485358.1 hypothetical protein [Saprospiraceae bacterium]
MSKQIHLLNPARERILSLPFYESLYDIPLRAAVVFLTKSKPIFEKDDNDEPVCKNPLRQMAEAVSGFYDVQLESILQANIAEIDDVGQGIEWLFAHITTRLGEFRGRMRTLNDCRIEIAGEVFQIPVLSAQTLAELPGVPPNLTVQEAIEAYEIARIAQLRQKDDTDGSALYTYYLNLLAVLFRKEGERLPHSEAECDRFIQERSLFFHNLPISAGIALDVDFFLASLMKPPELTNAHVGSLSNLLFVHAAATAALARLKSKRTQTLSSAQKKPSSASGGGMFTLN